RCPRAPGGALPLHPARGLQAPGPWRLAFHLAKRSRQRPPWFSGGCAPPSAGWFLARAHDAEEPPQPTLPLSVAAALSLPPGARSARLPKTRADAMGQLAPCL